MPPAERSPPRAWEIRARDVSRGAGRGSSLVSAPSTRKSAADGIQALPQLRPAPGARGRRPLPGARHRLPARRDPQRPIRAAVRRDHAREPPPQARPGAVGHAQGRRYGPAAGRDGLRRSALQGGVHRRPGPRLAAQPGPGTGRAGRRAAPPAPAQRRAGDRRAAVGAAVRRPVQQLPGAVGAHAAGAVPRRAAGAATDRGRRTAARAGDHLLADRPRRARRRGRVGPDPGGPRATDLDRAGRARPAAERDALGARHLAPALGDARRALHRSRRLRPGPARGRHLLPGPGRAAQRGHLVDAGPVPARPRPPADGGPQRLPVGAHRHHRPVRRDGPGPRPAGRHRGRRHAVPHQRPRRGEVHRRVLRRARRRAARRPGRQQRAQVPARRLPGRVGHPGAVPALARRQHLRERARRARRRTRQSRRAVVLEVRRALVQRPPPAGARRCRTGRRARGRPGRRPAAG